MTKEEQDLIIVQAVNSWRHIILEFKDGKHTQGWLKEYNENSITIRNIFGYKKYNRDLIDHLAMEPFLEVKKEPIGFIDGPRFPKGAFAFEREPQIDGAKIKEEMQEAELERIHDIHYPHDYNPYKGARAMSLSYIPYKD